MYIFNVVVHPAVSSRRRKSQYDLGYSFEDRTVMLAPAECPY
jgi:hypothetical protein